LTKLENGRTNRASPKGLFVIAILGKNSHLSMNYYFCVHTIGFRNLEGLGARKTKMPGSVRKNNPIGRKSNLLQ
jgi:hypothetical protein